MMVWLSSIPKSSELSSCILLAKRRNFILAFSFLRRSKNCSHGKELSQRLQNEVPLGRGVPRSLPSQQPHGQGANLQHNTIFNCYFAKQKVFWRELRCYIVWLCNHLPTLGVICCRCWPRRSMVSWGASPPPAASLWMMSSRLVSTTLVRGNSSHIRGPASIHLRWWTS